MASKVHRKLLHCNEKKVNKKGRKKPKKEGLQGEVCHRYNGFLMRQLNIVKLLAQRLLSSRAA